MSTSHLPHILLGAWHLPLSFLPTTTPISKVGYRVHSPNFPSVGSPPFIKSFAEGIVVIRTKIEDLLNKV
jgi:hypothetical protein